MKTPDNSECGFALIILNKIHGLYLLIELPLRETLKEISTCILKYTRLDDYYSIDIG